MQANSVFLVGRFTADAKQFVTASGAIIARGTLAINRRVSQNQEVVDFIPLVGFGKIATNVMLPFCKKGKEVVVRGRLSIQNQKEGDEWKCYANVVVLEISLGSLPAKSVDPTDSDLIGLEAVDEPTELDEGSIII